MKQTWKAPLAEMEEMLTDVLTTSGAVVDSPAQDTEAEGGEEFFG